MRAWLLWLCLAVMSSMLAPPLHAEPPRLRTEPPAFTLAAQTRTSAHAIDRAPNVVVHAPAGHDPRAPLHLVVFLHGYRGCAEVLMQRGSARCRAGDAEQPGWDLAGHHDAAGTNTLLVIPQLAFMRRDGDAGCFAQPGCFRRFLEELLSDTLAAKLGGPRSLRDLGSLTLVAHSAGFEAALAILEHGDVSEHVRAVVLLDALYAGAERYARWLLRRAPKDARLVSLYLGAGSTRGESRKLLARTRRALGRQKVTDSRSTALDRAVSGHRVVIGHARAAHRLVPERHLAEVLAALPHLPRRSAQ